MYTGDYAYKRDLVAIARKREKEGEWGGKSAPDTKRHTVRVEQCTINAFFPLQESRGLVALYHRLFISLTDRTRSIYLSPSGLVYVRIFS